MEREDLVKRVMAMIEYEQKVYDTLMGVKTPDKLEIALNTLNLGSSRAIKFLDKVKAEGIFKLHWKIKGMDEVWRAWARKQGIKEGDFLFEN